MVYHCHVTPENGPSPKKERITCWEGTLPPIIMKVPEKRVPPKIVAFQTLPLSTSMIVGEKVIKTNDKNTKNGSNYHDDNGNDSDGIDVLVIISNM